MRITNYKEPIGLRLDFYTCFFDNVTEICTVHINLIVGLR